MAAPTPKQIALILVMLGALNWGLSVYDFNVVSKVADLAGEENSDNVEKFLYIAVSLSAVWLLSDASYKGYYASLR